MDPAPVTVRARWPTHKRLVADLALGLAALGAMAGYALLGRAGLLGMPIGAAVGAFAGLEAGPRRYHLTIDADGVEIARLTGTRRIPWAEVGAFGIEDGWQGRRGVTTALAVGRLGDDWPITVPALAYHASGFRIGGQTPHEQLAPYRASLLTAVMPWADARGVRVVAADLDDWWDRNRDSLRRRYPPPEQPWTA